jgi:hypothetical protein
MHALFCGVREKVAALLAADAAAPLALRDHAQRFSWELMEHP